MVATNVDPFQEALSHYQAGRYSLSRDLCLRVLETKPEHAETWHLVGLLALQARDYPLAGKCIQRAMWFEGFNALYARNLGQVHCAAGQSDEAIAWYRHALLLHSADAETQGSLGVALEAKNDLPGALAAYQEAARLEPGPAKWYSRAANILSLQQRPDQAIAF